MRQFVIAVAALVVPAVAAAQPAAVVPSGSPASSHEEAITEMRAALNNLVVAEEAYFADRKTYTTDLAALRYEASAEQGRMFVTVTHAGGRAWRATVKHRDAKGKSCVIFVGDATDFPLVATRADGSRPTAAQEGQPVCDKP